MLLQKADDTCILGLEGRPLGYHMKMGHIPSLDGTGRDDLGGADGRDLGTGQLFLQRFHIAMVEGFWVLES
jgi:hypothetical protein